MSSIFVRLKESFIYIKKPLCKILDHKVDFFVWLMFTIVAGQIGIFANLILNVVGTGNGALHSIYMDSLNGSFYTFGIAAVTSSLGIIYSDSLKKGSRDFNQIKVVFSILVVFFLIFIAIVYASAQLPKSSKDITSIVYSVDYIQLFVYLFSIFICIYCYGLMKLDPIKDREINDKFDEKDTKVVHDNILESGNLTQDRSGISL